MRSLFLRCDGCQKWDRVEESVHRMYSLNRKLAFFCERCKFRPQTQPVSVADREPEWFV